jgi:hypothetical protein
VAALALLEGFFRPNLLALAHQERMVTPSPNLRFSARRRRGANSQSRGWLSRVIPLSAPRAALTTDYPAADLGATFIAVQQRLAVIRSKLDRLRAADVELRVFGARRVGQFGHEYRESPVLDAKGVAQMVTTRSRSPFYGGPASNLST